ncbi:MAG TPA: hypothetical protein ACFYED_00750 [Candidatus Tripitaka californicus]|uniref:hypothetical protein n=1 Tax=Candidatus Tripitaka californicus TaxID=3367616 RepID=UPI004029199B|nr:hypothetical protein [Planctomycetota bacterium]
MKSWFGRARVICLVGFAFFVGLSYAGPQQAMADLKCKLVNKSTGKGVPAEFSARVKDTIDKLYACVDTTGNGCTLKVPDSNAVYEVRCFQWNTDYNLVDNTLPQTNTGRHAAVVEKRMLVVKGNGEANFTCVDWKPDSSTYSNLKEGGSGE